MNVDGQLRVDPFYRENSLRVHEIPVGVKCPVTKGWPDASRPYDDVDAQLAGDGFNKYGWLLDATHLVVDIDVHHEQENGFESLQRLETDLGYTLADACGAIVETPSGGRHYYFSKPADASFGKVFKSRYPGIDFIAGKGKQVVAAGSYHDTSPGRYELSADPVLLEVPESLVSHLQAMRGTPAAKAVDALYSRPRSGEEFNQSDRGLSLLKAEMEVRGYGFNFRGECWEFVRPGKSTDSRCSGFLGKRSKQGNLQLTCFSLSDSFFPSGEAMTIFHAYALLCHGGDHTAAATALHARGFATESFPGVDLSGFRMGPSAAELNRPEPAGHDGIDDEDWAEAAVPESGLLRDIYDYYCQVSHRKSHVMGLAVSVSLCEMLFGRRIASHTDLRTNDYNVIIAPTNCGKEACEKTIVSILEAANPEHKALIPADVQSGNGLLRSISQRRCALWVSDEFGKVLSSVLDDKARLNHQTQIATHLLKLYGKSDSTYTGAAHSDGDRNHIVQPHLCVLGMTTGSTLFGSVKAENIHDGLFGRIAFWPVQSRPARRRMVKTSPPDHLVQRVRQWLQWEPGGNLASEHPEPPTIDMTPDALARWEAHSDAIDERMESETETRAAIWGRVSARAMKLAMIHFAARQTSPPDQMHWELTSIDIDDVEWGIMAADWLARIACDLVLQNIVDTSAKKNRGVIIEMLEQYGEVTTRDILRSCRRMTAGELMAEAKLLESQGYLTITETKPGGRGRPSVKLEKVG